MKILLLSICLQQLLFGNFLQLDHQKQVQLEKNFGKTSLERIKYIKEQINEIANEKYPYVKIFKVNQLFNKLKYKKNKDHWKNNYRASLVEFIATGIGDSMDFATAKFIALVYLGFEKKQFAFKQTDINGISRLRYDTKDYFVLTYYPQNNKNYVVLDCYTDKIIPVRGKNINYRTSDISYEKMEEIFKKRYDINYDVNVDLVDP